MMRASLWRGCLGGLLVSLAFGAPACSAGGETTPPSLNGSGGATSGGKGGTISTTGGASGVGTGGGSGGTISTTGGASGAGGVVDGGCTGVTSKAENQRQPADIVIAVDNSGSMTLEAGWVQSNMNTLVQTINGANIDAHVVLISNGSDGANGICVPTTLGSGSCPNDTNLPIYKRINNMVDSHNALDLMIQLFPQYQDMLRIGAAKHFVVVTDDNSDMTAANFDTQIRGLLLGFDPGFTAYKFHGIYSFADPVTSCLTSPAGPCCLISAAVGAVYQQLIQMTAGAQGDLCLQDFGPVFAALGQNVIQSSGLACEWVIPPPPNGETLDPTRVNMQYTPTGGTPQTIGYVSDQSQCANVQNAWYYDNPANPTKVYVCPNTCSVIQQGGYDARIDIQFNCQQVLAVPR